MAVSSARADPLPESVLGVRTKSEPRDTETVGRLPQAWGGKDPTTQFSHHTSYLSFLRMVKCPELDSDRENLHTLVGKYRRDFNLGVFGCRNFPFSNTIENVWLNLE